MTQLFCDRRLSDRRLSDRRLSDPTFVRPRHKSVHHFVRPILKMRHLSDLYSKCVICPTHHLSDLSMKCVICPTYTKCVICPTRHLSDLSIKCVICPTRLPLNLNFNKNYLLLEEKRKECCMLNKNAWFWEQSLTNVFLLLWKEHIFIQPLNSMSYPVLSWPNLT